MNNLISPKSTKKSIQVGRGRGSGKGFHTTGRGTKGQKSRSGYKKPRPGFEGGQNPLSKRLPKMRGLSNDARTNKFKTDKIVNSPIQLSKLEVNFKDGDTVTVENLFEKGLVKSYAGKSVNIKVVFDKDINLKLTVENIAMSNNAKLAIEKAGGTVK